MNNERLNHLRQMTKIEYTRWLIGYLAGVVDIPIQDGALIIDAVTLKKIPVVIDSTYKNILIIHDYLGLDKEHYKIFSKMDDFETEVGLFYIQDGEVMASPYVFKLASLQKSNLN